METWDEVTAKVKSIELKAASWQSDRKYLLQIIDYAMKKKIAPTNAAKSSISNLRTIIKSARKAISSNDPIWLSRLFDLAAECPTSELRVKVGHKLEGVPYQQIQINNNTFIQVFFTPEQFDKIIRSLKSNFSFVNKKSN